LPPPVDAEPLTSSHALKQKQLSLNEPAAKKKTKTRSCRKCGKLGGPNGCRGAARVDYCNNPCRDCNEIACRGRNPQHTDKPCSVGWGYYHNKDLKL
jgi:hypothetical protein